MARKRIESTVISEEDMTLAGRIRMSMNAKGIKNPSELARKMKLNRQTTHKWLAGQVVTLDPDTLFRLADLLDVNPRWLSEREGDPTPLRKVSPDDNRVLQLHEALKKYPKLRDAWLVSGDAMLTATGQQSIASPFKVKQ